jgi:MoxR-like ATPase
MSEAAQPVAATAGEQPTDKTAQDKQAVAWLQQASAQVRSELGKVIVGQDEVVEQLLIGIFAKGHCLLEGVPGLAKTLLISSLSKTLDMSFKRVQFTPDLMPSDIVGTEILQEDPVTKTRMFKFMRGPIFANIVLADEINRTPPKTQAALLEAMQEKRVTAGGETHVLEQPFFVLATQNPLDQEGTYPLPEAQLDRFIFKISVGYPSDAEELEVMRRVASPLIAEAEKAIQKVMTAQQVIGVQKLVLRVPVAEQILQYAKNLVRASRPDQPESPEFIKNWISWGAGPRASINLILAAKARAVLHGKFAVGFDDIAAVAAPVMRHRIACSYTATAEGVTTEKVVAQLLETVSKG